MPDKLISKPEQEKGTIAKQIGEAPSSFLISSGKSILRKEVHVEPKSARVDERAPVNVGSGARKELTKKVKILATILIKRARRQNDPLNLLTPDNTCFKPGEYNDWYKNTGEIYHKIGSVWISANKSGYVEISIRQIKLQEAGEEEITRVSQFARSALDEFEREQNAPANTSS